MNPQDYPVGSDEQIHALEIYKELLDEEGFTDETLEEIMNIIQQEEWLLESYNHNQLGFLYEGRKNE